LEPAGLLRYRAMHTITMPLLRPLSGDAPLRCTAAIHDEHHLPAVVRPKSWVSCQDHYAVISIYTGRAIIGEIVGRPPLTLSDGSLGAARTGQARQGQSFDGERPAVPGERAMP
jgi:hypothetical protein